jgi:hypothetical protein
VNEAWSAEALNEENRAAWNANASFWHERMEAGNDYHRLLLMPAFERMLAVQPGEPSSMPRAVTGSMHVGWRPRARK